MITGDLESEEIDIKGRRLFEYTCRAVKPANNFEDAYTIGLEVWEVLENGQRVTVSWDIEYRVGMYLIKQSEENRK
jgi:hypothetical protein